MKVHPIVPVPDDLISYPISLAEAVELVEELSFEDSDWAKDVLDDIPGESRPKKFMQLLLFSGDIDGFVFEAISKHWARVPAIYFSLTPDIAHAHTFRDLWGDLGEGVLFSSSTPNYQRYLDSPLVVMQSDLQRIIQRIEAWADGGESSINLPPTPVMAIDVHKCKQWLRGQFMLEETKGLRKPDFQSSAKISMPNLSGRSFRRAWDEVVKDFPERAKSGPRPSGG